jgi:hypothetical protein
MEPNEADACKVRHRPAWGKELIRTAPNPTSPWPTAGSWFAPFTGCALTAPLWLQPTASELGVGSSGMRVAGRPRQNGPPAVGARNGEPPQRAGMKVSQGKRSAVLRRHLPLSECHRARLWRVHTRAVSWTVPGRDMGAGRMDRGAQDLHNAGSSLKGCRLKAEASAVSSAPAIGC